jgi:tetratricopeptide (TPR) repeat protein
LSESGDLEGAIRSYHKALALDPADAKLHFNLGKALKGSGQLDKAIAAFRAAVARDPQLAEAHCILGLALRQEGQFQAALTALQRGHELGIKQQGWKYPSDQWVEYTRRLLTLEEKLPAILKGDARPASAAERLALAQLCQNSKQRYATAARLYAEAFAEKPQLTEDRSTENRYHAARAAARAAAGHGHEAARLDAQEKARLRAQARDWLRADLRSWTRVLDQDTPPARAAVQRALTRWLRDTSLAGLRDPDPLTTLPPAEQEAWRQLWAEVAELLQRGQQTPQSQTPQRAPSGP